MEGGTPLLRELHLGRGKLYLGAGAGRGPVILIFVTNIGFLIMAAVIMWRQQKKRNIKQKSSDVGGWLKDVTTLMVAMGITWIIGLAVVEIYLWFTGGNPSVLLLQLFSLLLSF